MINLTKELPQNTTVVQSEHMEQYSKVPMTAPSSAVLELPQKTTVVHSEHMEQNLKVPVIAPSGSSI